jgi:hypothetical protein
LAVLLHLVEVVMVALEVALEAVLAVLAVVLDN